MLIGRTGGRDGSGDGLTVIQEALSRHDLRIC